jgi:hypothetical protein
MPFRIVGWPEGHPHLTKVGGYPFGYPQLTSPNPLLDIKSDGSAKGYTLRNCFGCCWEHNRMKGTLSFQEFYRQSLAVTLSISSRTALDIGDLQCIELLLKLYPHVPFLKEHRLALLEDMRRSPRKPRFYWLLQPAPK